jgi:hypothetical protein
MYNLIVWKGNKPFHKIHLDDVVDQWVAETIRIEFNMSCEVANSGLHAKLQKIYPDGIYFSDN